MARDGVAVSPEFAALIARHAAGDRMDVAAECADLGVPRSTFYFYAGRFKTDGIDGLFPRSRRPLTSPARLPVWVDDLILRARKELADAGWWDGADSIRYRLEELATDPDHWQDPGRAVPARATINRVLKDHGQVIAVPKRRPRAAIRRFRSAVPNGLWQLDGFRHQLDDGADTIVTVLHIVDDCSSMDIALYAARSENGADTWAAITRAAATYGLPTQLLTDNGTAFSGRRRGWLTPLERNLAVLGVAHIASSVAHPQTCGKCERAHQGIQRWLAKRTYRTLAELQAGLDEYRAANNDRRRRHLDGLTARQRYELGPHAGPQGPESTLLVTTHPVTRNGTIRLNDHNVGIGMAFAATTVTIFRRGDHAAVFSGNTLVVEFDINHQRGGYQSANPTVRLSKKS